MPKPVTYLDTVRWSVNATGCQNLRLKDAIAAQTERENAMIELLALLIVLGIFGTVILVIWW